MMETGGTTPFGVAWARSEHGQCLLEHGMDAPEHLVGDTKAAGARVKYNYAWWSRPLLVRIHMFSVKVIAITRNKEGGDN